jgi:hypothetical protein
VRVHVRHVPSSCAEEKGSRGLSRVRDQQDRGWYTRVDKNRRNSRRSNRFRSFLRSLYIIGCLGMVEVWRNGQPLFFSLSPSFSLALFFSFVLPLWSRNKVRNRFSLGEACDSRYASSTLPPTSLDQIRIKYRRGITGDFTRLVSLYFLFPSIFSLSCLFQSASEKRPLLRRGFRYEGRGGTHTHEGRLDTEERHVN